ncbi:UDP-glucuronosyltransferase, putative [Ricinus communis]|uniref:UDP-glucuronosyltransferase, putative n=1 Tax=Ricinus communis TaxID=3988 RepID=B9SIM9_RICCO|nr:UDP-glucuronosyltransferase, putative [Ricinus communis]
MRVMEPNLVANNNKPHAVCIPYSAQGHINPMLKVAKLLHFRGFYITFVNTEYNHKRLLKSRGLDSVAGLPDFCFEAIPDGLPVSDHGNNDDTTQDIPSLCDSTSKNCLFPFRNLLTRSMTVLLLLHLGSRRTLQCIITTKEAYDIEVDDQ